METHPVTTEPEMSEEARRFFEEPALTPERERVLAEMRSTAVVREWC
jgi:hypothetical protein